MSTLELMALSPARLVEQQARDARVKEVILIDSAAAGSSRVHRRTYAIRIAVISGLSLPG